MSIISMNLFRLFIFIFADWFHPFRGSRQLSDFLQYLNLVIRSIQIMRSWFHNFNCDISSIFEIFSEPNCGEMAPSKFLNQDIPVDKNLSNMARMIATNFIILNTLILTMIFLVEFFNPVFQVSWLSMLVLLIIMAIFERVDRHNLNIFIVNINNLLIINVLFLFLVILLVSWTSNVIL